MSAILRHKVEPLLELLAGRGDDLELDRAALALARIEYPGLNIEPLIAILDSYAVELADRLGDSSGGSEYVEAANRYLFGELGFIGNSQNYYDPCNSCLNEVLTARTGNPITLAAVYLEIGRRLAKPVYGIGLPGHFLVQYRDADFSAFIDVFNGGRLLTAAECFELAGRATGTEITADPRLLAPTGKRQILMRMLNNLRGVYLNRRAYGKALQTLNLLLAGNADSAEEYKQRGIVHLQMRNLSAGIADLEIYLRLAPEARDRAEIERHLRAMRDLLAGLN
jgi:regulator of sirC expression with transglutaminase-like and TPR domain